VEEIMNFYKISAKGTYYLIKSNDDVEYCRELGNSIASVTSITNLAPSKDGNNHTINVKKSVQVCQASYTETVTYKLLMDSIDTIEKVTLEQFNTLGSQITVANGLLRNI
jgi:hypothetical protein